MHGKGNPAKYGHTDDRPRCDGMRRDDPQNYSFPSPGCRRGLDRRNDKGRRTEATTQTRARPRGVRSNLELARTGLVM